MQKEQTDKPKQVKQQILITAIGEVLRQCTLEEALELFSNLAGQTLAHIAAGDHKAFAMGVEEFKVNIIRSGTDYMVRKNFNADTNV